jgi:hypothetical protein
MTTVNFELDDAQGVSHKYEVELFSVDVNANLQLKFVGPVMQAIGRVIMAAAPAMGDKSMAEVLSADYGEIAAMLKRIDWVKAPEAVAILSDVIQANNGSDLVAQILCQTKRYYHLPEIADAPTITNSVPRQPCLDLAKATDRTTAFERNYGEYWSAALMVLLVNFTQSGSSGSTSLKDAFETLTLGVFKQSEKTEETPEPKGDTSNDVTTLNL